MTINLGTANEFIARHIGPRQSDEQSMLATLAFDSLDAMSASVIPDSIKGTSVLDAGAARAKQTHWQHSRPSPARTNCSRPLLARATTTAIPLRRSCATCWKTRPGTPPTPRTNPKFPKAAWKPC